VRPGAGADGPAGMAAAATADERFSVALAAIPGLDVAIGLKPVRGNLSVYLRVLRLFAQNHGGDALLLRKSLAGGERALAERLAHTLKGVAATIGATALNACAASVEQALKHGDSPESIDPLLRELEAVVVPLADAVARATGVAPQVVH